MFAELSTVKTTGLKHPNLFNAQYTYIPLLAYMYVYICKVHPSLTCTMSSCNESDLLDPEP